MRESLRMMATDAPGTFQAASAAFTYASNPGNGSRCGVCADKAVATQATDSAAANERADIMEVSPSRTGYRFLCAIMVYRKVECQPRSASLPPRRNRLAGRWVLLA